MPQPLAQRETGAAAVLRCTSCGAAVEGTRHTRAGYVVGYYLLHTGRTEETTVGRGDEEGSFTYRRLVEPADVLACPRCFARADVRRTWTRFGDAGAE